MSPTEIMLLATLKSPIVALDKIAMEYFNLSPPEARRRAALNMLPMPTFRMVASQKAPLLVNVIDLAQAIDKKTTEAREAHEKSQL